MAKEQIGYALDSKGKSLVTGKVGDWKEEWVAIGSDGLGDPIFVDTSSKQLEVLTAMHGEGDWDATIIAESLNSFSKTIDDLKKLSRKRTNPEEIEKNPISDKERGSFMHYLKSRNTDIDFDYWELFIHDETE